MENKQQGMIQDEPLWNWRRHTVERSLKLEVCWKLPDVHLSLLSLGEGVHTGPKSIIIGHRNLVSSSGRENSFQHMSINIWQISEYFHWKLDIIKTRLMKIICINIVSVQYASTSRDTIMWQFMWHFWPRLLVRILSLCHEWMAFLIVSCNK